MSAGEVVIAVVMGLVMLTLAILRLREGPRPSRFHQALWAESVRKRGLSEEEAMKEAYVLGYVKDKP